jgi:hypothetical protein
VRRQGSYCRWGFKSQGGLEGLLPSPPRGSSSAPSYGCQRRDQHFSWLTGEVEWLGQVSDALLTKSVIHRSKSATYEAVLGGESYRQHEPWLS